MLKLKCQSEIVGSGDEIASSAPKAGTALRSSQSCFLCIGEVWLTFPQQSKVWKTSSMILCNSGSLLFEKLNHKIEIEIPAFAGMTT
jgi:hypothetical protein